LYINIKQSLHIYVIDNWIYFKFKSRVSDLLKHPIVRDLK